MFAYDVVLITEDRYVDPPHIDDYIANILTDDDILTRALSNCGLKVRRVSWSDPAFDWSSTRCAVFRTTWDYFNRFDEFIAWLNATEHKTRFINDIRIIRWNMDKHYLADLQKNGVRIVDTTFIEKSSTLSLRDLFAQSGQEKAIIKPAVSGAARHTYMLTKENIGAHASIFSQLIAEESMLFQPFQQHIVSHGEVSYMVMHGKCTHAVLKKAKQNDFRVQDDFGGTVHPYTPNAEEIAFAESAVAACPYEPLYARVDVVRDNFGELAVMELELIEPELWFRKHPPAAAELAKGIHRSIH